MKRIFTFVIIALCNLSINAQQRIDYNHSKWFFGLNVGTTWETADVRTKNDLGWGLTLGKSFNYDYGRVISFDIRGRFLSGNYYGQNKSKTTNLTSLVSADPNLLNGYDAYQTSFGYTYLNHKTVAREGALELVLHLNRLRERSGWDVSIFGGVGIVWKKTYTDLLNSQDSIYKYNTLTNPGLNSISNLRDKKYETVVGSGLGSFDLMPSVGFGIGRQVSRRGYIGIEHRTTFTRSDGFDGFKNAVGNDRANDLSHYTSVYWRWYLKTRVNTNPINPTNPTNPNNTTNGNNTVMPVVVFRNPAASGTTVSNQDYVIKADVFNVTTRDDIVFKQNGNYVGAFAFNSQTNRLESSVLLVPGQNVFEITAVNQFGTDLESTIIIFARETITPPRVDITNPSSSPITVSNPAFGLFANVFNVQNQSQITATVNGQNTVFTWNQNSSVLNMNLNLQLGSNVVSVTGTNAAGTDSETVTIIYQPQSEPITPRPIVVFTDPAVNPYTTAMQTHFVKATVLNVNGSQNITFKQNGVNMTNFSYNASTNALTYNASLNAGQNIFEIVATNNAGSASATTIIVFDRIAPKPPIVTITNPSASQTTSNQAVYLLTATVLNVSASSQINMTLNGNAVSNFSFNPSTFQVTANLNLVIGTNTVMVKGTNSDGTDNKTVVIIYTPTVSLQVPIVTFVNPSTNPLTVDQAVYNVIATVLNVENQSQVNVSFNGQNVTNFQFNPATHIVSFVVNLNEGANLLTVTGTNTVGVDTENTTILYKRPTPAIQIPVVTFIDPATNPITVFSQSYNLQVRVTNVASQQNIQLKINGIVSSNFSYNASSQMMIFASSLIAGANIFEVTGTNTAGSDVESTTIIYRQQEQTLAPTVNITDPSVNPLGVSVNTYLVHAAVQNITTSNQITVSVNGSMVSNFTFNPSTSQLTVAVNLSATNVIIISATNAGGSANDQTVINYKAIEVILPPVVTFLTPASAGTTVSLPGLIMKAKVLNVNSKSDIEVRKDGAIVPQIQYTFNASLKEISLPTTLIQGNNIFQVSGTNGAGTNSQTTTIIYKINEAPCLKPVLNLTSPLNVTSEVELNSALISGIAINCNLASQVSMTLNGQPVSGINFNTTSGLFSYTATLTEGQNILEVSATNACGTVKGNRTIIYKKPAAPCLNPSIQRILPVNNISVQSATIDFKASVTNITEASQMSLTVNGVSKTFTFDIASQIVMSAVPLTDGINEIRLTASNNCGSVFNVVTVQYNSCVNPTISLISESAAGETFSDQFSWTGSVGGSTGTAMITIRKANNMTVDYNFNASTGLLSFNAPLEVGDNVFNIAIQNSCGAVSKQVRIIRKKVIVLNPPTVSILNPEVDGTTVTTEALRVLAEITNIVSANQVVATVNGSVVQVMLMNNNGQLGFNTTLQVGMNTINVTVSNASGSASDTRTIVLRRSESPDPNVNSSRTLPSIQLINPTTNPFNSGDGVVMVTGTFVNVTQLSGVQITINGVPLNDFNPIVSGLNMNFSFPVTMSAANPVIQVLIVATNNFGSVNTQLQLNHVPQTNERNNGKPGREIKPIGKPGAVIKPNTTIEKPKPAEKGSGIEAPKPIGKRGGGIE